MSFDDSVRKLKDEYLELCNKRETRLITKKEYKRLIQLKIALLNIKALFGGIN